MVSKGYEVDLLSQKGLQVGYPEPIQSLLMPASLRHQFPNIGALIINYQYYFGGSLL